MSIKLKRVKAGYYKFDIYNLIKWQPDTTSRYLWCLSINGLVLDDFKTLAQAKLRILKDMELRKW